MRNLSKYDSYPSPPRIPRNKTCLGDIAVLFLKNCEIDTNMYAILFFYEGLHVLIKIPIMPNQINLKNI